MRDAIIAHQKIEIVPRRLGEFRLCIELVHDAQIGRQPGGETLEILARDAAARRLWPEPLDAIAEVRRGSADGVRRHQRIARGAGLPAPRPGIICGRNRAGRGGLKQVREPILRCALRQRSRAQPGRKEQRHETRQEAMRKARHGQGEIEALDYGRTNSHLLMCVESRAGACRRPPNATASDPLSRCSNKMQVRLNVEPGLPGLVHAMGCAPDPPRLWPVILATFPTRHSPPSFLASPPHLVTQ